MAYRINKGINNLPKKASGLDAPQFSNVIYRGTAFPELQGKTFKVPSYGGSGRQQREYIESEYRKRVDAEAAAEAAKEAADELAAVRAEMKQLKTQVKRLRSDVTGSISLLLTAAGVDRERALGALEASLVEGEIKAVLTDDEIGSWLSRTESKGQD